MNNQQFTIEGMDCPECARAIERGVARLEGVTACRLNFTTARLRVTGDVDPTVVMNRVRELGYEIAQATETKPEPPPTLLRFMLSKRETQLALIGLILVLPGTVLHELLRWEAVWIDALALAALALVGPPIALKAWRALRANRELSIDALMSIAAVGAVIIGAYVEAGLVMVLYAIGEALEGYTASRARHAIRSLLELTPPTATVLLPEGERIVPVAELQIGDRLLIRPGERIPVDGTVVAGSSLVNQAPITGESRLIERNAGDPLFAGTMNGEGSLEMRVERLAAESAIARMIRLVEEAQERRAPVQRFVDRFARIYTPLVVILAALIAIVPPLVFGQPFWNPDPHTFGWFYRGLALLVVACPCALVISTPVSLVSALSTAARHGVLIKGGAYLETLARVTTVAVDKTGTLTSGKPAVVGLRAVGCTAASEAPIGHCPACDELLVLAGAVEHRSEHPLARAIVSAATSRGLALPAAEQVRALVGKGVQGIVNGAEVLIGSHRVFDQTLSHDEQHCLAAQRDSQLGRTPLMVGVGGEYRGTITVADTVRPESRSAISTLRQQGLHVVMLTGDDPATAKRIAGELGVNDTRAGLLPEDKAQAVSDLRRSNGAVAMVGDGINDAPALASADVGIAIGTDAGGTTQAMETADITLLGGDLRQLPFAIALSRATMRTIAANVAFSIGIKLLFIALVLAGFGTMWMAVLADVGASLLVTLNGMRLLGFRELRQA
ncbi:heavy metal translocating P-type ATPase [Chloroflexus sp.]|uniref:heavy metal translocating P-type ATPase n=1 Tax=Chloroflexus sp. TaxID=1904827 RepID=UPI00261F3BA2|nr:heavy metal translocating P-type ATPase [uncultured Chloroflexus sp.]